MRLTDDETTALGHLNPRRFEILLCCLTLDEPFTAGDVLAGLREEGEAELSVSSLNRDLRGLESGGLLAGSPPLAAARKGRTVQFHTTELAETLFAQLSGRVASVLESRGLR
ncbi:hypothetical protein B8X04_16955 [Brevibacterium casei]|uniref:Transcriptional regulator n=1 Tax=Brevibacterium casei TaxID=33889 RepID=A0A269Z4U0_9MICO|nr:hypothetical protein [Brevibacterium casei]PAK92601.1 hypothetical protein B8X04_16955 [Brevibacterium casei]